MTGEHERRIGELLPGAAVHLGGSALVTGEPADYDLVVLVDDVAGSAARLADVYPPLYPEEWRDDWAAFRDPGPPQVDIVLTVEGSDGDRRHRLAWRLLAADPQLLAEYRAAKETPEGKREFFARLAARL